MRGLGKGREDAPTSKRPEVDVARKRLTCSQLQRCQGTLGQAPWVAKSSDLPGFHEPGFRAGTGEVCPEAEGDEKMVVLVTYDLKKPGQDYAGLIEALKNVGTWWHYLESTWLLDTSLTPSQVWERIKTYVDKNDRVLVVELKPGTAASMSGWLEEDAWQWLRNRL